MSVLVFWFVGSCVSMQARITESTEDPRTATSFDVCAPVEPADVVVFQSIAPFYEGEHANRLVLVGPVWGQRRGPVIFFYDRRIAGRGTFGEEGELYIHTPIGWPREETVWGIGGDTVLSMLSDHATFDAPLQMLVTSCDPSEFLRTTSLDFEGDGIVDVEFGSRVCPSGGAFEVRTRRKKDAWEVLGRWIQPWHEGEGRPRCAGSEIPGRSPLP